MIYVALLRGINVGGNNKINMKELKASFEDARMNSVVTYINSGNIIFSSNIKSHEKLATILEKTIQDDFNLSIKVIIRSFDQFKKLLQNIPDNWQNNKEMKSDVLFLWKQIDDESILAKLTIKKNIDNVSFIPGAVLWNIERKNQAKSGLIKLVGTKEYKHMTIRNVNTVRKIYEIMNEL